MKECKHKLEDDPRELLCHWKEPDDIACAICLLTRAQNVLQQIVIKFLGPHKIEISLEQAYNYYKAMETFRTFIKESGKLAQKILPPDQIKWVKKQKKTADFMRI